MHVIPGPERQKEEDCSKFEVSLVYMAGFQASQGYLSQPVITCYKQTKPRLKPLTPHWQNRVRF